MGLLFEEAVGRTQSMGSILEAGVLPSAGDVLLVVWMGATPAGAAGCRLAGVDGKADFLTPGTTEYLAAIERFEALQNFVVPCNFLHARCNCIVV